MKKIVDPKCPYCHTQFTTRDIFDNPLSGLYGEYCRDTVDVECPICKKTYFVSKQTRFIGRKKK